MLSINNLSFYIGDRALYDEASLHIKPKQKIALIGANGTGKSTLLRLIMGEYSADGGSISKSGETTVGFLNQDLLSYETSDSIVNVAMQAFAHQLDLQKRLDGLLAQCETNYSDELMEKIGRLQEEFEHADGYGIRSKTEAILEGLGFTTAQLERPLREFSGGWRMRVMLAKLLLESPDLLLLDEPTNHLDLPSVRWVEEYLRNYSGAIVVVSHDRDFLDRVSDTTVEVWGGKLDMYAGNYTFYEQEKVLRAEIQSAAAKNQQQRIKQTERFVERFRSKASKARQVQSRVKALEKEVYIEEPDMAEDAMNFKFTLGRVSGRKAAVVENITKAYGDLKILEEADGYIERGDKIALIGANGRGKSTLLRIVAGTESFEGNVALGHNTDMAFYAQHQLESLNVENEVLEELKQAGSERNEGELRSVLGCFLFRGDDVFKKIKVLSGGEKSRVALAKTLISKSNFLLLDEPTNHLDIRSVNILAEAVRSFEGSCLIVSHDRHFIRRTANKIWYIENHKLKEYPGTYDEFIWKTEQQQEEAENRQYDTKTEKKPKKARPERSADEALIKKLSAEVKKAENLIEELERKAGRAEAELAKPEVYEDSEKLSRATNAYRKLKTELEQATGEWEDLMLQLEEAGG